MRVKKFILCLLFSTMLIFENVTYVYADAVSLTVSGAIATGGLSGAALVSAVQPYLAPVVLGVLVAGGMDIYLTQQSEQAGMTKTEFVKNKIADYCEEAGRPIDAFWQGFADSCSVTEQGAIYLGDQARTNIKQFLRWLTENDQIYTPSIATNNDVSATGKYGATYSFKEYTFVPVDIPCTNVNSGAQGNFTIEACPTPFYVIQINNNAYLFTRTGNSGPVIYSYPGGRTSGSFSGSSRINWQYSYKGGLSLTGFENITWNEDVYNFFYWLDTNITSNAPADPTQDMVMDPSGTGFTDTNDALSPSGGATVLNPDILSGIDTSLGDIATNVQEYLETIGQILDGIQDPTIDGIRVDTGEREDVAIDPALVTPTIDIVADPDIPTGDDKPETIINPTVDADPGTLIPQFAISGLQEVFPFCLPFDIYHMLQKLSANPVAPKYDVNWHIPIVNTNLQFTVDLSGYNSVASTLRTMELIAFCIGLAVVTRQIIRG